MSDGAAAEDPFAGLPHDPRDASLAGVRASDRDRGAVVDVLADAFADGRLDRAEYDRRAEAALRAAFIGDLAPLLADLAPAPGAVVRRADDLEAQAVDAWRRRLRGSATSAVSVSVLTTGIWAGTAVAAGGPYFFWPVFPIVATCVGLIEPLMNRQDVIARERRKLERRRAAELSGAAPEPARDEFRPSQDWREHRDAARQARHEARARHREYRHRHR